MWGLDMEGACLPNINMAPLGLRHASKSPAGLASLDTGMPCCKNAGLRLTGVDMERAGAARRTKAMMSMSADIRLS
jgi:hypothetical protein